MSTGDSLSIGAHEVWARFLQRADNRGHAERPLSGANIGAHYQACLTSARANAARVANRHGDRPVRRIVEIGCSTGLNAIALAERYPDAEVVGIEPEAEALAVANALAAGNARLRFVNGVAERIPLADRWADIIVCHTVLEHVYDVDAALSEMVRILGSDGTLSLEAPNYRFPFEPHLGIWCVPALGKRVVAWAGGLQGRWRRRRFLDHLQFITTPRVSRRLTALGCNLVTDEAEEKILALLRGGASAAPGNAHLARMLGCCRRIGLGPVLGVTVRRMSLFPSMLLVARLSR